MGSEEKLVTTIMQKNIVLVQVNDPIEKVERIFRIHRQAFAVVLDEDGQYYGLITASNLLGFQLAWKNVGVLKAREICCTKVISGSVKMKVREAAELMLRKTADYLVIMEAEQVIGVVSPHNLMRELMLELDPACFGLVDDKGVFVGLI